MSKKQLTIDDATALRIYPNAPAELKAMLEDTYSKEFFAGDITDRIKTFEDACEYNNTNPKASRFVVGTRNQIYQERVAEIVKALNEGWVPNYDNSSEYKYSPIFYLNAPGFRFDGSDYVCSDTYSAGGSRFALKSMKLSNYAGTQFVKEYEMWLTAEKENTDCISNSGCSVSPKAFSGTIKEWEDFIIPRVSSFEDACREIGANPNAARYNTGTADEIAYKKGKLVCDVLNQPFMHLMKDTTSRKWYAWMEKTDTGFRFLGSIFGYSFTFTTGGSRLRLCSEKLAKHFAISCCEMMAPYWWNE
jgi:hypothetical protein